ncbi:hypothetical protein BDA99DRAFT_517512 [Phascolomyces articulosus]|uniref:HAM1-like C-terminal domain-containing protein n=1 Tax=Phascolomyces articulosus TaxID=60185 RepID=A0AAD5PBB7_9FUNG|nr:hypothetical protein BDA99DRAFT_517512 [Phascolomyces articulosus]
MLYRTIKPLMVSILKRHIEKNIESKIIELIDQADSKITNSVTKQYKDAMAKETSTQTIVTPSNYQQTVTTTSTPVVITTTAATDETHVVPIESQERPGLFVALLTIMNRSIRSLMISGMQDQQAKQRKKKMEKMSTQEQLVYSKEDPMQDVKRQQLVPAANTSNTVTDSSSKMSIEGNSPIKSTNKMMMGSTPSGNTIPNDNTNMDSNLHIDKNMVSVIVGSNGHTYMEKNSKLVPVHIVGGLGADHIQMNGQYGIVQTNHVMKNSSFSSNKDNQDLNTSSSQDINNFQQQYHHSITEANTERT